MDDNQDTSTNPATSRVNGGKLPTGWYEEPTNYWFPTNQSQVEMLMGRVLTQIEAMNLPPSVEKANKDVLRSVLWRWFGDVQENSLTSTNDVIAPIHTVAHNSTETDIVE